MTLNLPRSDFIFQGQVLDCSWSHPCYICMHSWYYKGLWIKKDIKWHTLYANINDMTARVMVSNEHGRQKGNECVLWLQSLQFNHTTFHPSAKMCKKWVEHKMREREGQKETERERIMMKEDESRRQMRQRSKGTKETRESAHDRRQSISL